MSPTSTTTTKAPLNKRVMGWSELHGDMQIEAEMTSRRQFGVSRMD